jgi:conjugative relaxase-like TrwC/TraI family protein
LLSIGIASGGYYASLANEDYYHAGGEPPGLWVGSAAEKLGLNHQVDKELFLKLCDGFSLDGKPLTQNAGEKNHRAGYDLTFSAPKSVSVLWSQADPLTRLEIQRAQLAAVKEALAYLEDVAALTRRGKGGVEQERCGLLIALFEHGTSRAQDPQLHTHAVILNIGFREDGTTGTLESRAFFRHKMAAGALYRTELARQLEERLSVKALRAGKNTLELEGVDEKIISEFSKRREAIEEAMKASGAEGAARAAYFTLTTREKKEHVARELLFEKWQETGRELGFSAEKVFGRDREISCKEVAVEKAVSRITESQAYFTEKELVRRTAEEGQGSGLSARDAINAARSYLEQEAIHLGRMNGEQYFTTREIDALEKQMLSQVEASKKIDFEKGRQGTVAVSSSLNEEQRKALYQITQKEGLIQVVSGMAGTGKTTLLNSAREIWEARGYEVKGLSLAAVAAKNLEEGAKIRSQTIAKFLYSFDTQAGKVAAPKMDDSARERKQMMRKIYGEYKHATWQWSSEDKKRYLGEWFKPTSEFRHEFLYATWQISKKHRDYLNAELVRRERNQEKEKPLIGNRTILVVDEAGMVGTRQMSRLIDIVSEKGAKLILVGDEKQLQPIEHGAPFKAIGDRLGRAELTDIKRQRDEWARDAVKSFAIGEANQGLRSFADHGLLTVTDSKREAMNALINDWSKDRATYNETLILAGTRAETKVLNLMAQELRQVKEELGDRSIKVNGGIFFENDRVLFTKNKRQYGVNNGDLGTIKRIDERKGNVTVILDSGEKVRIPVAAYKEMELGYAVTTHKGQGKTVEKAFVLVGGEMDHREFSYVQMSRSRGETRIYTEKAEVGDTLTERAKMMSKSQQKSLAQDISAEQRHRDIVERRVYEITR